MPSRHALASAVCGLGLLTASALTAAAQEPSLEPGTRVRVRTSAPHRQTLVGTMVAWKSESLVVNIVEPHDLAGTRLDIGLEHVARLEVSRGRRARTGRGVLVGAGVGLASGAIAGAVVGSVWPDIPEPGWLVGAGYFGGIGLVGGAGIGALIGTMVHGDDWQGVSLERLRVSVLPASKRWLPLGVSVRFEIGF